MRTPAISVIIATYNRAGSLPAAVRSVLTQSRADLELLIVDDGSTDGTRELVSNIQDPRVRYLHQANKGLAAAWNLGVEQCRAEIVAFLDSDDIWLEGKLEKQFAHLERQGSLPPGWVTGYLRQPVRGRRVPVVPTGSHTAPRSILWRNVLHIGTTLVVRRKTLGEIGPFDETLRRGQDTDWLLRYRDRFSLGIVREVLAVFHQHLNRSGEIMEASRLHFLKKHDERLRREGTLFHRRKVADVYRDLAYQFSREGNAPKAQAYARRSLASFPAVVPGVWLLFADSLFGTRLKRGLDSLRYPGEFR